MTQSMPSFAEIWERFQKEQKWRKAIEGLSNDELQILWDKWDGTELMTINLEYIPEDWVYAEIHKRGLEAVI